MGGDGLGERVDEADGGVQGGVAFDARDGVAFKAFLVEEDVDDFVFVYTSVCNLTILALWDLVRLGPGKCWRGKK